MQPSSSYYRKPQETILVANGQNPISSDHPMFYVRQKNYFLQQLSNKVAVESKFNQIDLKRNVRVDHLIQKHSKLNKAIQKEQKRRNMYLSSNQFTPIVGISEQQKRRKRQQKQAQKLRQQLYQNYIQQCEIHQAPQNDQQSGYKQFKLVKQNEKLQNLTVLSDYRSDPNRRKELYLIDMQISKLRQQQNLQRLVKKKQNECSNNQFLSKVSNTILSSYMVYFDQIFNLMIDQILEQEVVYFNNLEANYYMGNQDRKQFLQYQKTNINKNKQFVRSSQQRQYKPKNFHKQTKQIEADLKAMKMMELVRCLDDLAFD